MTCSNFVFVAAVFIVLFFLPASISTGQHLNSPTGNHNQPPKAEETVANPSLYQERWATVKRKGADPLQIAGSSLPDCSHACGSCSPCRLVMVSFVCASLEEAETCPMAYKCMCNNKSYPVP